MLTVPHLSISYLVGKDGHKDLPWLECIQDLLDQASVGLLKQKSERLKEIL